MMKKILMLTVMITGFINLTAQVIDKEVINRFSPGVISRLYDIARTTSLTKEEQIKLAMEIDMADSFFVKKLKEEKTSKELETIVQEKQIRIFRILNTKTRDYTAFKAGDFARQASSADANYMKEAYLLDDTLTKKIYNLQYGKYKNMYQVYLLYGAKPELMQERIINVVQHFDSIAFATYPIMHSGKYLDSFITSIKRIKPSIPDTTVRQIQVAFFAATKKNVFVGLGETLLGIMQHVYPDTAITAYFYKADIEKQTKYLSAAEKDYLINKQHISKLAFDSVYGLVKQKNYQQVLLEYTYGGNAILRDSLIRISNKYYDSLTTAALLRDGSLLSTSQFAIALKYKKILQLSPSLTDTLLWHAMYLDAKQDAIKRKDPFAKTDFKAYEAKYLNTLLSEDQYTKLLTIKNSSAAQLDAEEDWADMETWKITADFDKASTLKQLYNYYLAKWIIYYRLANDKLKQEANLKMLKDAQPKALKILSAAKKLPNPVNDNTNLQLRW